MQVTDETGGEQITWTSYTKKKFIETKKIRILTKNKTVIVLPSKFA